MKDFKSGAIDALVTAPINKAAMQMAKFPFIGHTEYITSEMGAKDSLMLMVSDNLRVGVVTNHLPIKEVAAAVTRDKILRKIQILNETLKVDFGIDKPLIAVLGLNPHAGDEGAIGKEDENIVRPAIEDAKNKGVLAFGPYPADGFFGSGQFAKFDGILAIKLCGFIYFYQMYTYICILKRILGDIQFNETSSTLKLELPLPAGLSY